MCPGAFKENRERPRAATLYLHVPFCRAKCRYCDFYSRPVDSETAAEFVTAAQRELDGQRDNLVVPLRSVFVGGGTPTVLEAQTLQRLLAGPAAMARADTEFSIEANPATLDAPTIALLPGAGVNRVSLGVQSFHDEELRFLGRLHTAARARHVVHRLRAAGVANLSLDLIYALPGQTLHHWRRTLDEALSLEPEHLSCYALSIEDDTPLAGDVREGRIEEMSDELQRACYELAIEKLTNAGYEHYEISNFAKPGRCCIHNLTYWHNRPYVGIGPAAASYLGGERRVNRPDVDAYMHALEAGAEPPYEGERLEPPEAMAEALMLGLRLTEGVDRSAFARRYGKDPSKAFPMTVGRHLELRTLVLTQSHLRLAPEAFFVANSVLADFFAEVR